MWLGPMMIYKLYIIKLYPMRRYCSIDQFSIYNYIHNGLRCICSCMMHSYIWRHFIHHSNINVYRSKPSMMDLTMQIPSPPVEFSWPSTPSSWPSQVYLFKWHMGHYGAPTPKPQQGWTNSRQFAKIRKGKWSYSDNAPSSVKTVKKTICKTSGKSSYCGTPELKASQSGTYMLFPKVIFKWCICRPKIFSIYRCPSSSYIRKNS